MSKNSELYKFAKEQLRKTGILDSDEEYDIMLSNSILELIDTFDNQGHSGFSAFLTLEFFSKLVKWEELV